MPTPTTIIDDRRLLGISLISHLQACHALIKGAKYALLYVCLTPQRRLVSSISQGGSFSDVESFEEPSMELRMKVFVEKYKHLILKDGLPPQLPSLKLVDLHIELVMA